MSLIELREKRAEAIVHCGEDNRMGHNLSEATRARRQGEEHTRGQKDEQKHGDKDVGVEHLY
jgi:hypothetical protein